MGRKDAEKVRCVFARLVEVLRGGSRWDCKGRRAKTGGRVMVGFGFGIYTDGGYVQALLNTALDQFAIPGDASFPLNQAFEAPKDRQAAETLRQYA